MLACALGNAVRAVRVSADFAVPPLPQKHRITVNCGFFCYSFSLKSSFRMGLNVINAIYRYIDKMVSMPFLNGLLRKKLYP